MQELSIPLLRRAFEVFLKLAYPQGEASIPPPRRAFLHLEETQPLDAWLAPPICQAIQEGNEVHGYAGRLGCGHFPHLKLRATNPDRGATWVFSVDTHDAVRIDPNHPDAPRWAALQQANQQLKERIEHAWEAAGLLTFDGLLRRDLDKA
jgi:hypothetical protein